MQGVNVTYLWTLWQDHVHLLFLSCLQYFHSPKWGEKAVQSLRYMEEQSHRAPETADKDWWLLHLQGEEGQYLIHIPVLEHTSSCRENKSSQFNYIISGCSTEYLITSSRTKSHPGQLWDTAQNLTWTWRISEYPKHVILNLISRFQYSFCCWPLSQSIWWGRCLCPASPGTCGCSWRQAGRTLGSASEPSCPGESSSAPADVKKSQYFRTCSKCVQFVFIHYLLCYILTTSKLALLWEQKWLRVTDVK